MPTPTRYIADASNLLPWISDDILANLPRAAPESSMEAMMMARRAIPVMNDPGEALRRKFKHIPFGYERGQVVLPPTKTRWDESERIMSKSRGWAKKRGRRYVYHTPRPYSEDTTALRALRRQAMAEAYLDQARANPEIANMLPLGLRPGFLPDKLLARLAAESPQVVLGKALQDNPEITGGLIGAGGVLGGGVAYGLLSDEEPLLADE